MLARLIPANAGNTGLGQPHEQPPTAHPRQRGEHHAMHNALGRHWGSSPPTRGTRHFELFAANVLGLIPANAGNTVGAVQCDGEAPAHPRQRGEHVAEWLEHQWGLGSSPPTRGTHTVVLE